MCVCRDCFVLNSTIVGDEGEALYNFVGKLFGLAIRSKNYLNLKLVPPLWGCVSRCQGGVAGSLLLSDGCGLVWFALSQPSYVWKQVTKEPLTLEDLNGVDNATYTMLKNVCTHAALLSLIATR